MIDGYQISIKKKKIPDDVLSEAVREVEQIEPTNGELEGKLEEAPVLRENEGFSQGLNLADISIKEIKRNILEVYKEYFQRKEKGGGLLVASNDRSSYTAEELKTYQHTDVQTWIMQHMHLEQDEWKFNENINEKEDDHVLYYLIQNGIIIENFCGNCYRIEKNWKNKRLLLMFVGKKKIRG